MHLQALKLFKLYRYARFEMVSMSVTVLLIMTFFF